MPHSPAYRTFDHGELNVPLSKRQGNIDAQIDAYKARQAAVERTAQTARYNARRAEVAEAKSIAARISAQRLSDLGAPYGITGKQTALMLVDTVRNHGARALTVLRREVA